MKRYATSLLIGLALFGVARQPRIRWEWMQGPLFAPVTGLIQHKENLYILSPQVTWSSANGGRSWHKPPDELASASHVSVTAQDLYRAAGGRIDRSSDAGRSWEACAPLPLRPGETREVNGLRAHGNRVYAAVRPHALFGSGDRCESWAPVPGPWASNGTIIVSFVYGDRLIVRTAQDAFLSSDAGRTWVSTAASVPEPLTFEEYCDNGLLAGTARGVRVSRDGGRSWTSAGLANRWVPAVTSPRCGVMYAAAKDEVRWTYDVLRSTDDGKDWTAAGSGLSPHPVYELSSSAAGAIYLSGVAGLFRSDSLGSVWDQLGPREVPVTGVTATPWQEVFAATGDALLSRSASTGSWRTVLLGHDAHVSEHDPLSSARSLVSTAGGVVLVSGRQGLLRSTDRGRTWRNGGLRHPVHAFSRLQVENKIVAATSAGLFTSTDEGQTWTDWSEGLSQRDVLSIGTSPNGIAYAGTRTGEVFRAGAGGKPWSILPPLPGAVQAILVTRDGGVLAGTAFGCFRWRQGDAAWLPVPAGGVPAVRMVRALVHHPDGAILAATEGLGIFVSYDGGTTWTPANDGLSVARVLSLSVGTDGSLYAGTTEGAFRGAM